MQSDSKGNPFDPTRHPLAQARTKSFDVLLEKTEAFVPAHKDPLSASSPHLSPFVSSQNDTVLEYLRTLDEERTVVKEEELAWPTRSAGDFAQGDDASEAHEDVLSALDSVDSFLQTHDYVVDLRRKLQQTSLSKTKTPSKSLLNSTRARASSAPNPPSPTPPSPSPSPSPAPYLSNPPSPSPVPLRSQSRASGSYDFVYSRPALHVGSELSRKIDELRNDPIKRAELEERIQGYRDSKIRAISQQRNVLEDNKDMTRYSPEVRALAFQEQAANRERQIGNVLDTKKEIAEETLQRRLAIVHRKEIEAAQEERKVQGFVHKSKVELIQRRWMVMIAFGARQGKWMASLQQARLERLNFAHRDAAARRIQKAYRRYIAIVRAQRMHRQITMVHTALRKFIFRFRSRRRHRAADTIRKFVDDILDTTRVAKVIKKFRFGVTHAQRYMREMLETEKVQLSVLVKQWNRAEHELETAFYHRLEKERARQVIMSKSLYYEGTSARPVKNRPGSSNKQFSLQASPSLDAQYQQGFPKVPTHVKLALLLATLREKKIVYGKALAEYARLQALYDEAEKRKEGIEKARQILADPPAAPPSEPPNKPQPLKSVKSSTKSARKPKQTTTNPPPTTTTTTSTTPASITPFLPSSTLSPTPLTPPPKPLFTLLLTHEEAIVLVNKGVSIVQQQQKQLLLKMQLDQQQHQEENQPPK